MSVTFRIWRKGWRPFIRKRRGRKKRFVIVYKGKPRRIRITRRGVRVFRHRKWKTITLRRPHRRRRRKLIRRLRRRSRRVVRRIRKRVNNRRSRRRRKRRRRRQPITGKKLRRPRIIRCGMRVRFFRRWRPVVRYRKHFFVRYRKRRVRVSFRKSKFRILYRGKWRRRPSYRRIKVYVNKKYRFVKKITRKGVKTWITRCYGRRRRIRFRNGRRIIKTKTTWTRVTRHVLVRARIRGKLYPISRRGRQWYLTDKKKPHLILLRGNGMMVRFKKKWKKIRGNPIQVNYNRRWRTVSNCCKKLRLRVRGRSRQIYFRHGGLYVKFHGRMLSLGQIGRRVRHVRRKLRKKKRRRLRLTLNRGRQKRFGRRRRRLRRRGRKNGLLKRIGGWMKRRFGKRNAVPKGEIR